MKKVQHNHIAQDSAIWFGENWREDWVVTEELNAQYVESAIQSEAEK